ncbi:MAG: DUF1491 family protein [Mesorhizobium sp.]|jgi:hypothetical protein
MRLTTDIFVSALIRRVFSAGGFAAVANRGAAEAGAIFLVTRDRFGQLRLYGPAAQTAYDSATPEERRFSLLLDAAEESAVEARLARERRFDADIWVIELEPGSDPVEALVAVSEE